jgi:hypothetical protein
MSCRTELTGPTVEPDRAKRAVSCPPDKLSVRPKHDPTHASSEPRPIIYCVRPWGPIYHGQGPPLEIAQSTKLC